MIVTQAKKFELLAVQVVPCLRYCFSCRIKAAQKQQLSAAQQGITSLTKLSILDVRSIWIHTVISHCGLPSNKASALSSTVLKASEGSGLDGCLMRSFHITTWKLQSQHGRSFSFLTL